MQNRIGRFTRSAQVGLHNINRRVDALSSKMKTAAAVIAASAVLIGGALGNVISTGADFGRAIGSAAAKFPDQIERGTQAFKDLEDIARKVGRSTEYTSTQAAQGLNFLAKAGYSARFSIAALPDIVDFATASEMDFAEAADIASDALGAFGLDSQDLGKKMAGLRRVMDVMSKTANMTNTSVSELFEAVQDGAPIAAQAGVSIETFSAAMGFLASSGIKASKAGTAAKNITLALAGVGNQAAKTFKKLGISLSDSTGNLRDQFDILDDLRKKLAGVSQVKRVAIIDAIFGKIPIAAASKLLDDNTGALRRLRTELLNSGGTSKRVAAYIRNDVKGSLDGLLSAIEGVKISIFKLQEGPLKQAIDRMTEWVRVNENAIAAPIGKTLLYILDNFKQIATWIERVAIGLAAFWGLNAVLKALTATMTLFNLVTNANPLILVITTAIGLFVLLNRHFEQFTNKLDHFFKSWAGPIDRIKRLYDSVRQGDPSIIFRPPAVDQTPWYQRGSGGANPEPQVMSGHERIINSMRETKSTNQAEITLKAAPGTSAEVTKGSLGRGLMMKPSGAF